MRYNTTMKFKWLKQKKDRDYTNPLDYEAKMKRIAKITQTRFIILIVVVAMFMSLLVGHLYKIQVIDYQANLALAGELRVITNTSLNPRGDIVDREGTVLASTREYLTIVYSRPYFETQATIWEKAEFFAKHFDTSFDHFIFRDYQDAFLVYYEDDARKLITEEEYALYYANELSDSDLYELQAARVDQSMIDKLTQEQLEIFSIYQKMAIIPGLIKTIKTEVTAQEVALILENIDQLAGFNVVLDWQRQYSSNNSLGSIIGSLYSSDQGLPQELAQFYQAQGYNVKDTVGRSGLEQQYEAALSGEKAVYTLVYDDQDYAQIDTIYSGQKGATLKTTFDLEFQKYMEESVQTFMEERESDPNHRYYNRTYFVVSDPNNGDVLVNIAMKKTEEGTYYNSSNSTYLDSYSPGSAIKGAVVYMALDKELMSPGEIIIDAPIKIRDTPIKSSFNNLGPVNDLTALSLSSNVFMWYTVIRLGEGNYQYNMPLYLNDDVVDTMRYYFSLFGLGNETQLDIPNESTGYKSSSGQTGNLLDYAIGQYDTYTAMQLNQYVSTIANGRYRYAMRFVSEAFDPVTNEVILDNKVQILNTVDNEMAISRVQQGFRLCVTNGLCTSIGDAAYPAAVKTGTAQDFPRDTFTDEMIVNDDGSLIEVSTNTVVAYAPYENPEIAISCIMPYYTADRLAGNGCLVLAEAAVNYYAENNQ